MKCHSIIENKNVEYTYDADGNRIMQEQIKDDRDRKVEFTYDYEVNRYDTKTFNERSNNQKEAYDTLKNWQQ